MAQAARRIKCLSSGWAHATLPRGRDLWWQQGYGALNVSQSNAAAVIRYIERQEAHHRTETFEQEFLNFLHRHNIEYDPKYVWD